MAQDAFTIQNGLNDAHDPRMTQTKGTFNEFNQFVHGVDATSQNLQNLNPFLRGQSRIFMYKPPKFMQSMFPDMTTKFKDYLEGNVKRIDGIGDMSVSFAEFEGGFAARKYSAPTQVREDTESFSVAIYELSGSLVKNFIESWVTGRADPYHGLATYHGGFDQSDPMEFGLENHTAEFLYYVMDPSGRKIEYSCLLANCFPSKVPKGHFNWEAGSRDNVELDLDFNAVKYESRAINELAMYFLSNSIIKSTYLDFNPNVDTGKVSFNNPGGSGTVFA